MTALAAARTTQSRNVNKGTPTSYKMAGSTTIYAGSLVMLKSDGYAAPAAAASGNLGVVGVAQATVVNAGADGAAEVVVDTGDFLFAGTTLAIGSVGKWVYAEDDQTVDETQGSNEPLVGILVGIDSSSLGWVRIDGYSAQAITAERAFIAATYDLID